VSPFTVVEGQHNRRPDVVLFVNGLPLALVELKNATDEDATIADEVHRSQSGFASNFRDALPKASFIGFTARRRSS